MTFSKTYRKMPMVDINGEYMRVNCKIVSTFLYT